MKTMRTTTKTLMGTGNNARRRGKPQSPNPNGPLFLVGSEPSLIEWPTERQIQEVSTRLARISRMGIRSEAQGDYFKSGDLAYQLHEIIQATDELFKKIQRIKR